MVERVALRTNLKMVELLEVQDDYSGGGCGYPEGMGAAMNSLELGKLGKLGKLGFGGAGIGNLYRAIPDGEALATVLAAWDAGIRYFDTAPPHYGLGLSEQRLGAVLRDKPPGTNSSSPRRWAGYSNPIPVAARTRKVSTSPASSRRVWDFSEAGIRRSMEDSLERLGLGHVDIAYLHDPDATIFGPESPKASLHSRNCAPREWSGQSVWASTPPRQPWNVLKPPISIL